MDTNVIKHLGSCWMELSKLNKQSESHVWWSPEIYRMKVKKLCISQVEPHTEVCACSLTVFFCSLKFTCTFHLLRYYFCIPR